MSRLAYVYSPTVCAIDLAIAIDAFAVAANTAIDTAHTTIISLIVHI